jgi:L-serine kinase (ATP) / ParB family transcriptional regulator, heme-responsive regulator
MLDHLPHLTFLPVDKLLIHERHDAQRTRPLVTRIRASGIFRNPPIVSPLLDGSERCMVLDGANRVTALKEMRYPHALVQVVEPEDPGLNLQHWNHVVWELNPARFLIGLRETPRLQLMPVHDDEAEPSLEGDCGLALIKTCKGHTYMVCTDAACLEDRVDRLHAIVDSYIHRARLDRTSVHTVEELENIYPQFSGLVIFPHFQVHDLLGLAGQGYLLPAGITRFTIAPRALHVNYPLHKLAEDKPVEEKNEELRRWLQDRLAHKGVRFYAEPTVLFDE